MNFLYFLQVMLIALKLTELSQLSWFFTMAPIVIVTMIHFSPWGIPLIGTRAKKDGVRAFLSHAIRAMEKHRAQIRVQGVVGQQAVDGKFGFSGLVSIEFPDGKRPLFVSMKGFSFENKKSYDDQQSAEEDLRRSIEAFDMMLRLESNGKFSISKPI